jgi:hypothetical protein
VYHDQHQDFRLRLLCLPRQRVRLHVVRRGAWHGQRALLLRQRLRLRALRLRALRLRGRLRLRCVNAYDGRWG